MATIEHYDWRNFTYSRARDYERIWHEAISDDPFRLALYPESFQFAASRLPPIGDYDELLRRARHFKRLAEVDARNFCIHVRSDPRAQIFMLKDEDGEYASVCLWSLPSYLPQPRIPLLHRLKTWFMARWYAIRNWWTYFGHPKAPSVIRDEHDEGRRRLRVVYDTPERFTELQRLEPKQLEETTYPVDYAYYLKLFATRKRAHGRGYGRQLLESSLQMLGPHVPPPQFAGPPKATLQASPPVRQFYEKCGYTLGNVYNSQMPSGEVLPHTYYFRNLTPAQAASVS